MGVDDVIVWRIEKNARANSQLTNIFLVFLGIQEEQDMNGELSGRGGRRTQRLFWITVF